MIPHKVFLRHKGSLEKREAMALRTAKRQFCVFTHVASIYANLLEQKKAFTQEKSSTPTGLVWDTKMAVVSLFWDTNVAAMTSCETFLLSLHVHHAFLYISLRLLHDYNVKLASFKMMFK